MKTFFYPRLAWDGLRKNRRLSVPYLLTCVCMVSVFYILGFLVSPDVLAMIPRGRTSVAAILSFGRYVILLFSLIFLYYTWSFLLRRRAREFGLYNVLGMGRWNLVRIISWESLITFAAALLGGLLAGILLSKIAELGLVNLMGGTIDYAIRLDWASVASAAVCYAVVFALIWLSAVIRTARSTAVSLMKADSVGEKPPKGNWLVALLGVVLLGAAYWLAVSIEDPVSAIQWFFAAVLLVIVATYLLMIAGSVRMCRILQSRKGYYYKARHFVSVSSMAYRMKRNGAGLASICIIATMILVMLSTTTCMWFGADDSLRVSYPREMNVDVRLTGPEFLSDEALDPAREEFAAFLAENGVTPRNVQDWPLVVLNGTREGNDTIQCDYYSALNGSPVLSSIIEVDLVSASRYTAEDGSPLALAADEALLLAENLEYTEDTITLAMGDVKHTWRIRSAGENRVLTSSSNTVQETNAEGALVQVETKRMTLVVPDLSAAVEGFQTENEKGYRMIQVSWKYNFDTGLSDEENLRLDDELGIHLGHWFADHYNEEGLRYILVESRAAGAADFFGTYGSLFFIGILLSLVFLMAAVLIIYYKQISEGYEDAKRFDIMQKVGMTKREIRSSISSQLLTVFALPLLFAGIHLIFAFPMIRRMLTLFSLYNVNLFIRTTAISFVAFAVFYAVIYRLTSGVYYRIVSSAETK